MTVVAAIQPQDIQLIQTDPNEKKDGILPVALIKSEVNKDDGSPQDGGGQVAFPAQYLQNPTNIQEYLQKMQQNTALPLSLQQFLKFNSPGIKQEHISDDGVLDQVSISTEVDGEQQLVLANSVEYMEPQEDNPDDPDKNKKKKKYKKKPAKPKKPKVNINFSDVTDDFNGYRLELKTKDPDYGMKALGKATSLKNPVFRECFKVFTK